MATELCTRSNFVWLAADDPDEGERDAIESIGRWSRKGVHRQHYSAMLAACRRRSIAATPRQAWRLLGELESIVRQTYLGRVQVLRVESLYLRARSALAMAAWTRGSGESLSAARTAARRIASERRPWSDPLALLMKAAVAHLEGNASDALAGLHDAVDRFDAADMHLYAAVTRLRIGALQNDWRGRELKRQAEQWMAAQQIRNPACMTRMLAPGFPDPI